MTITLTVLLAACGGSNDLEPVERTQTAIALQQAQLEVTQVALGLGSTQTALAAGQATQGAQVAATQTSEANPNRIITRNADWTPVEQDFDGVTMVQVPGGCFMMGSEDGSPEEQPVTEVCFEESFWLDKLEVTQAQFAAFGGPDLVDVGGGGVRILLRPDLPPAAYTSDDLREAANTVERRVLAMGYSDATVQVASRDYIVVEVPGIGDPQAVVNTIQQTALLEFVDFAGLTPAQVSELIGQRILTTEQAEIQRQLAALQGQEPGDSQAETERLVNPITGRPFDTVITGAALTAATAENSGNGWVIRFQLTDDVGEIFSNFTGSRIGQPVAIVLDGEVLSAPTVQTRLTTSGVISSNFTQAEAERLALQLRTGALSVPLDVESVESMDIASRFIGDNRPMESITWYVARAYCEARGGRLPTEAEWEYAARGPDSLIYPWGNAWNPDNVVWAETSGDETATVGSIPAGASWVGALDMSGNVWEWTSSANTPYPYDVSDGREATDGDRADVIRVIRGGSFGNTDDTMRSTSRSWVEPFLLGGSIGVRCAADG
jgi:formylglycine-generating enzyme required for sulfatase activity